MLGTSGEGSWVAKDNTLSDGQEDPVPLIVMPSIVLVTPRPWPGARGDFNIHTTAGTSATS